MGTCLSSWRICKSCMCWRGYDDDDVDYDDDDGDDDDDDDDGDDDYLIAVCCVHVGT